MTARLLKCIMYPLLLLGYFTLTTSCEKSRTVNRLLGTWEIRNSVLQRVDSAGQEYKNDFLGTITLTSENTNDQFNMYKGEWTFVSFPDSLIPLTGKLLWYSGDKGDFSRIPWYANLFFSQNTVINPHNGNTEIDGSHGNFSVSGNKKQEHYLFFSSGFLTQTRGTYQWTFELVSK